MTGNGASVACVGVGTVGRGWAIVFARAGYRVRLYDQAESALAQAQASIQRSVEDLEAAGLIDDGAALRRRILPASSLAEAVADARHVQESIREDAPAKAALFEVLALQAPADATLASSTSALPGSRFLDAVKGRERCLVAHPVNPPYLIPLVELCPTPWTAPAVTERVRDLMREVGQHPILLRRETPGFLLNRLQYTLVGEALHLLGEGYCEPEDIDAVLTEGLALRWVLMGPLQVAHLNASGGFAAFVDQLGDMMRSVGRSARPDYPWDEALIERIHERLAASTPASRIAERQAERDRRLMALLRWRRQDREVP